MSLPFRFVDSSLQQECRGKSGGLVGNKLTFADSSFRWDDLGRFDIALLGLEEEQSVQHLASIRRNFYHQYLHNDRLNIIDLGDISADSVELSGCLLHLQQSGVLTLLLSPSTKPLPAIFSQAVNESRDLSITSIAADIPVELLADYFVHKDSKLSRYTALAYQTYLTDGQALKTLTKHSCEAMRLGILRANIAVAEPLLRDTHLLSIDINAVRASDGGSLQNASPNGLYAEELCQLAWYAGKADSLGLCVVCGFDSTELPEQGTQLIAQAMWHVVDGYAARRRELPTGENIKRFMVDRGKAGEELLFFQSSITNRWWMGIPILGEEGSHVAIACTYEDYQKACAHEIPDRWLLFYQKLNGI